jgi:hypothetical protein
MGLDVDSVRHVQIREVEGGHAERVSAVALLTAAGQAGAREALGRMGSSRAVAMVDGKVVASTFVLKDDSLLLLRDFGSATARRSVLARIGAPVSTTRAR